MKVNSKLMGFGAGTKILMADGSQKPIEQVKTGDYVLSFDQLNAFGELEPKRVLNTYSRLDKNPLHVKVDDIDAELVVAEGQLFINPGSDWKDAININEIIDGEGNVRTFEVSRITRGKHFIYDIIVEDNHSLIANGVRVHNMNYSIADVIAGRNLAGTNIQSGPVNNYYRTDDLENSNQYYQEGNSKKRKRGKKKDTRPVPKVDGTQAAAKLLSSLEDLLDGLSEIVADTSPTNLTTIKLVLITSVDNIRNYIGDIGNAILNSTMSAYDKSEILVMSQDMLSASVAMRKPFEEATVSPAGKLVVLNLLKVIDLQMIRIASVLENYTGPADEDRDMFDVERDGQRTRSRKNKQFEASRDQRGNYREGGSRSDFGSTSGRGSVGGSSRNSGGGPNPARNTNPEKTPRTNTRATGRDTPTARPQGLSRPVGSPSNLRSDSAAGLRAGGGVQSPNQAGPNRGLGVSSSGYKGGMSSQGASYSGPASAGAAQRAQSESRARSAATSSTTRNSSNFCFAYNTMFKMADGSIKAIQDIQIGDNMLLGGKVLTTIISDGTLEDWYIYNGVKLTGAHPVLDRDGKWRKVSETSVAIPTEQNDKTYILINENHKMIADNGEIFTDWMMVGLENKDRARLYYRDFENLFRIINNEPLIED